MVRGHARIVATIYGVTDSQGNNTCLTAADARARAAGYWGPRWLQRLQRVQRADLQKWRIQGRLRDDQPF